MPIITRPPYKEVTDTLLGINQEIFYDSESGVKIIVDVNREILTIVTGNDRLDLNRLEYKGLYSGILNIGPIRE
jgi:hypothetical protein